MKSSINTLLVLLILLVSCNVTTTSEWKFYIESQPTFFDLRNTNWVDNKWIRKPENMLAIHETFKRFGYKKLIANSELFGSPLILHGIYINKQGHNLLDSLELTYHQTAIEEKYYREFWQRRRAENNDSIVFIIIKDINAEIKNEVVSNSQPANSKSLLANDTLLQLLQIEYRTDKVTEPLALHDFEILKNLGFHESAYNLLFKNQKYLNLKWNRDSLERTLTKSDRFIYPWFADDAK